MLRRKIKQGRETERNGEAMVFYIDTRELPFTQRHKGSREARLWICEGRFFQQREQQGQRSWGKSVRGIFQDQQGSQSGWREASKVKSEMRLERWGHRIEQIIQGLLDHFHFYAEWSVKQLDGFEQRNDMIWFTFLRGHSSCCVENRPKGWKKEVDAIL